MSKTNFRIDHNDRLLKTNCSRKRFLGARNSEIHISTTKSPREKGFDCQKKVKLTAKDVDSSTSCRLEASPIPLERKEVTIYANHPKTSEYAFFKKLKEDAGQRCHSNSLQKDAYISKKPESNDCFRERINDARISSKCFNSSTLTENTPTVNSHSSLFPSGGALKKADRHPINSTPTPKRLQEYGDTFQAQDMFFDEGTHHVQGKTFFRKRQKLRQWVADASIPDIDKLCSKGHDIVSMLLSRLFSNSIEENKYYYPKSGKVVTATRHDLLESEESDIQFKEHHQIPKKKFLELDPSSYSSDHLSSPMFHRPDERMVSCADFPTYHSHKIRPPYSITEPECNLGGTASFNANSDLTLGFLFNEQEHKSLGWNHFKELGKRGRDPNPLFLENDFDSPAEEINIPVNHSNAKLNRGPALLTSLGNCEEQTLNKILGAHRLCSSSTLPNQPLDFNPMLDSGLIKYQGYRFGKYVYEDLDTDFNHAPLSLPYNKDHLKLLEECRNDNSCVRDSFYVSPYQHLLMGTVSNVYHHHADADPKTWLSSSLDFSSGRRCLPLAGQHQDHQIPNYGTLQLALRESMSDLFHSKDNYKQDLDSGIEGEMLYQLRQNVFEMCNSSFLHMSMQRDNGYPFLLHGSDDVSEEEQTHKMLL